MIHSDFEKGFIKAYDDLRPRVDGGGQGAGKVRDRRQGLRDGRRT